MNVLRSSLRVPRFEYFRNSVYRAASVSRNYRQIFEKHNFRGFRGLTANRENYAPRNKVEERTLPQLQLVGDRWYSIAIL